MSRLPSFTWPDTTAPRTMSCIRFRERSSVVLPEPDGPIRAVTWLMGTSNEQPRTATFPENATDTSRSVITEPWETGATTGVVIAKVSGDETTVGSVTSHSPQSSGDEPAAHTQQE